MIGTGAAIFGCESVTLGASERDFFRDYDPFGFIIFARNVENPDQLRRLTAELRGAVGRNAPILIDQEGGRVQRLRAPHWREWSPPLDAIAKAGAAAARMMALRSQVMAHELVDVGIDCNCAPLADIASAKTHAFLRNRCYGETVEAVSEIARAVADAHLDAGVLPVAKHLPGHGRSESDTHLELPTVSVDRETLAESDFLAFKALADLPMAMTAHIIFSAFDSVNPATQSPEMLRVIRHDIGFRGLLMTDDLNMQALQGDLTSRAERSIAAGCDIALHCKGVLTEMLQVAKGAGTMSSQTRDRAHAALAMRRAPRSIDIEAIDAELASLCNEGRDG